MKSRILMTQYEGELASLVVTAQTLEPRSQHISFLDSLARVAWESHLIFLGLNVFTSRARSTIGAEPVRCGEAKGVSSVLRLALVTQKCHFPLPWLGSSLTANFQFRGCYS